MEEKVSVKPENHAGGKLSGLYQKLFILIKFVLGILLLPLVYASTQSFLAALNLLPREKQSYFNWGLVSFLLFYLFVWEAQIVYKKGQQFLEIIFRFFAPLVRVAPYLLPIYTIFLFILYWPVTLLSQSALILNYLIFALGFSIALHLVFSAKALKGRQADPLKANYIFGFSFIYILNIILVALGFNLLFKEFSLVNFLNASLKTALFVFQAAFRQLFL